MTARNSFESVTDFSLFYRTCIRLFLLLYLIPLVLCNYLVFGIRFRGRDILRRTSRRTSGRGVILVSNHSLYLDPAILIHTVFPRRSYYTGLKSHFYNPVGGFFLRLIGGIPIPDWEGMQTAEQTARRALDLGHYFHFFPEGKMTHLNQQPIVFKSGAFHLAVRLQAPVVPVTIVHRRRRLFGRILSTRFIRVTSAVGEPVDSTPQAGESTRETAERLAGAVRKTMMETINRENQIP